MKVLCFLILSQVVACSSGCTNSYLTAAELDRAKMGPTTCENSCRALGMRMGALALIDSSHAGCVCVPNPAPVTDTRPALPAPLVPDASPAVPDASPAVPEASVNEQAAAVAAGLVAIVEQEARQQSEQGSQRTRSPAHTRR